MLITLFSTIVIFFGIYLWIVARKYSHLPGYLGSGFPIIGNLYYSLKNSFLSHDEILTLLERRLPPGGGVCVVWVYCLPVLAISDPSIVEKLAEHPAFVDKEPLVYENIKNVWIGTFVKAYSDSKWKQRRKIINHSMKNMNLINYHNTFVKISKRMVEKMGQETGPFKVKRYSMMATMESILETHFDCNLNLIDDNELYEFLEWGIEKVAKTFFNPVYGFFLNIFVAVTSIMKPFNQIVEFGSHTVGILVNTVLVFLATLPEIQEKAWQEQQNIFGDSDRDPTFIDVKNMDYLERVIKEVLRFVTGPSLARRTKDEIIIDDMIIPPKTTVIVCSRLMHMDDDYWKNASTFDPDRFLENEPSKSYKHSFSFFGLGTRNCPGMNYSYNETKVMLSTVLRRFKVVSDRRFEDIKLSAQIMMNITEGQNISIVKRKT
ncbi:cytochrome P450 4C1 isoform X2 [Halyomorpha halys]|uniref:cytochrome P450 4C1 isoform X2 n=1 Tax=Halyomorpha halys TaxID=286706 RepID=UPI0034D35EDF